MFRPPSENFEMRASNTKTNMVMSEIEHVVVNGKTDDVAAAI